METLIVLLEVGDNDTYSNAREACEAIEGARITLGHPYDPTWNEILDSVGRENVPETEEDMTVYSLAEFMAKVNDEEFYPDLYFMSYITVIRS